MVFVWEEGVAVCACVVPSPLSMCRVCKAPSRIHDGHALVCFGWCPGIDSFVKLCICLHLVWLGSSSHGCLRLRTPPLPSFVPCPGGHTHSSAIWVSSCLVCRFTMCVGLLCEHASFAQRTAYTVAMLGGGCTGWVLPLAASPCVRQPLLLQCAKMPGSKCCPCKLVVWCGGGSPDTGVVQCFLARILHGCVPAWLGGCGPSLPAPSQGCLQTYPIDLAVPSWYAAKSWAVRRVVSFWHGARLLCSIVFLLPHLL